MTISVVEQNITVVQRSRKAGNKAAGLEGAAVIATDAVISVATGIIKISVFGLAGVSPRRYWPNGTPPRLGGCCQQHPMTPFMY
jgi:hypothetical protein